MLFCDANASWGTAETRRFLMATRNLDYTLEQPCASYEENLAIRRACDRPLVLDETIDSADVLLRAIADGLVDGITIKLARVGGLTKAKLLRDIAIARNLKITIEDTGGAEIDTAAYCGLMLSTPENLRQHTVDFHNWVTVSNARADFRIADGAMAISGRSRTGHRGRCEARSANRFCRRALGRSIAAAWKHIGRPHAPSATFVARERRSVASSQKNACRPVCARPRISAWTSCAPS